MIRRRRNLLVSLVAASPLMPLAVSRALAQTAPLPAGPVNLISGFAAGGGADTAARIVARKLADNLGRPVVVQNRVGAGGNIATQAAAVAAPDGLTLLFGTVGPLAITPHLMKVPYDPERDLAPITMGMSFPNVLVVHPDLGVKSLSAYIALAKGKPGTLTFGSSGIGSSSHLTGELFNQRAGVEITHVPYKGGSQVLVDLLAGRISSCFFTPATAAQHVDSGKLIALATTGLQRAAPYGTVPTVAESGFAGFTATNWYAFLAPARTPDAVLDYWNRELTGVLNASDVREQLLAHGLPPAPGSRDELKRTIATESATWARLIRERKIVAET